MTFVCYLIYLTNIDEKFFELLKIGGIYNSNEILNYFEKAVFVVIIHWIPKYIIGICKKFFDKEKEVFAGNRSYIVK